MLNPRRDDFELPEGEVYLNGGYLTPFPRAAHAAVESAWNLKARPFTTPPTTWRDFPDSVRGPLGRVLQVPGDEIGITTSTHFGAMLLAQGMRWREGDRMLLGPDEYPSNVYPWLALEERGVQVERVGTPGRRLAPADLSDALARRGRVRALAVAAVHYVTGDLQPLDEFAELLKPDGAHLIVEGAQAAGAIDVPWGESGADALLMSGYKWLYGPVGSGAIWVKPALREQLANVNANWLALEASTDFDRMMREYPRTYEAHGRLFDVGQAASHFNIALQRAGVEYLLSLGIVNVEAHHRAMQDAIVEAIAGLPLRAVTRLDDAHRGPLLLLEATEPDLDLTRVWQGLRERRVHVSLRGGRLRVSPGMWNGRDDAAAFANAVGELLPASRKA